MGSRRNPLVRWITARTPLEFFMTKMNAARRNRRLLQVVLACFVVWAFVQLFGGPRSVPTVIQRYHELLRQQPANRSKCDIPLLDPFDPSIAKYFEKPSPLVCSNLQPNLTFVDQDGFLRVDEAGIADLDCEFRYYSHQEGDDFTPVYEVWRPLTESIKLQQDFVEVRPSFSSFSSLYRILWVKCRKSSLLALPVYSFNWNFAVRRTKSRFTGHEFGRQEVERPSVIVVGLDSMSHSNFLRQLPKTTATMREAGFTIMNAHTKIGDNTYANLLAMLTGRRAKHTAEFEGELKDEWNVVFDDFPFVWKQFANHNYSTFFAEDRPDIGTFNYFGKLKGFLRQPTDHYLRTYFLNFYDNSLLHRRSSFGCYGNEPLHRRMLAYLQSFLDEYAEKRKFAFFWSQGTYLSHDFLNRVGIMDDDLEAFVRSNRKHWDNAVVLFISDHGHRYDPIRETTIGRFETRLPFFAVRLPPALQRKFPQLQRNLERNSNVMTTQYDVHSTFEHLLSERFDQGDEEIRFRHGYSVLGLVPANRSCFEASIPDEFCPCVHEIPIPVEEGERAAAVLLDVVNKRAAQHSRFTPGTKCLELELEAIQEVGARVPPPNIVVDPQTNNQVSSDSELRYRVMIKAKPPSNAILEASIAYRVERDEWTLVSDVERNNRYGNSSYCVGGDPFLKKTCHCISV